MKPTNQELQSDGSTLFLYAPKELEDFHRLGEQNGNVGFYLHSEKFPERTFKGYGTIENPSTSLRTLTMVHNPVFDGDWTTGKFDDDTSEPKITFKWVVLDFAKMVENAQGGPNLKKVEGGYENKY